MMKKRLHLLPVLVFLQSLSPPPVAAGALHPESIAVTGVYTYWGTRYPQNTLTGPGNSTTRETMWTTVNNHEPGYLVFSLNDRVALTHLEVWNWNNDWNTIGMKEVELLISEDWGTSFQAITNPATGTTLFTLTQGPYNDSIQPDTIPVTHTATHIIIDPQTWYGIRAGLSYVQFFGVRPTAPSLRNRPPAYDRPCLQQQQQHNPQRPQHGRRHPLLHPSG